MAVQQNRKTRSKRGMRRAHDHLENPTLGIDALTGEVHRRHHLTATGYYKGVRIIDTDKVSRTLDADDDTEE